MHKKIKLAEEKDLGKIIGDAFLFFKQQFWNYTNCLFITTAPFFILYVMSVYALGNSHETSGNFIEYFTVGNISGCIGLIVLLNVSNAYMIAYSIGHIKIKPSDLTRLIADHWKGFVNYNLVLILLAFVICLLGILLFAMAKNYEIEYFILSCIIIFVSIIGVIFLFQINSTNIISLRENIGFIKSYLFVFVYSKKNMLLIWSITLLAIIISSLCQVITNFPLKIITAIGTATSLFNTSAFLNNYPTLNIVIQVANSVLAVYLGSILLIIHQILFFSIEEKYKGAKLINKIKDIGDA